jgi:hypothetical protein
VLDRPLTRFTAISAAKTLNYFSHSSGYTTQDEIDEYDADGYHETQYVTSIFYENEKALSVADVCNALELLILYLGFIICFPAGLKRKVSFGITGHPLNMPGQYSSLRRACMDIHLLSRLWRLLPSLRFHFYRVCMYIPALVLVFKKAFCKCQSLSRNIFSFWFGCNLYRVFFI